MRHYGAPEGSNLSKVNVIHPQLPQELLSYAISILEGFATKYKLFKFHYK